MNDAFLVLRKLASVLAHPKRAQLFLELRNGRPLSATSLASRIQTSVQSASYHLKILIEEDVIQMNTTSDIKFVEKFYTLRPEIRQHLDLLQLNTAI